MAEEFPKPRLPDIREKVVRIADRRPNFLERAVNVFSTLKGADATARRLNQLQLLCNEMLVNSSLTFFIRKATV